MPLPSQPSDDKLVEMLVHLARRAYPWLDVANTKSEFGSLYITLSCPRCEGRKFTVRLSDHDFNPRKKAPDFTISAPDTTVFLNSPETFVWEEQVLGYAQRHRHGGESLYAER